MGDGTAASDRARAAREGLQRQRTVLAWNRTAVAMALVGVLLGNFARAEPFSVRAVPAVVALVTGLWMTWVTHARPGGLEWREAHNRLRYRRTVAVALITTLVGLLALALLLDVAVT